MDDVTVQSLRAALSASPDNLPLWTLLTNGLLSRGEHAEAAKLVGDRPASFFATDEARLTAARALQQGGDASRALELCDRELPELLIVKARALLSLGRQAEATEAYERAVALNATCEDTDLAAQLKARVREVVTPLGPRLRVIANDDTDEDDAAKLVAPPMERITFADVGGLHEVKKQIERKIILPFQKPSLFERFKRKAGGGILLYGPPGCGKTMLARATAGECQAEFLNVAISDVLDMYIGESERKLHALFEKARQKPPAVLFFDELEALAGKRQFSREGSSAKVVSQFLSEMDGFAKNNQGVLILGATNVPWAVDPAFRRPGRFDRVLFVPPPDEPGRRSILELMLKDRPVEGELKIAELAAKTVGFTGADLQNLVETAVDNAIERSLDTGTEVPLTRKDLVDALGEVKPTAVEWLTTARNYARYSNEGGQYDDVLAYLEQHAKD